MTETWVAHGELFDLGLLWKKKKRNCWAQKEVKLWEGYEAVCVGVEVTLPGRYNGRRSRHATAHRSVGGREVLSLPLPPLFFLEGREEMGLDFLIQTGKRWQAAALCPCGKTVTFGQCFHVYCIHMDMNSHNPLSPSAPVQPSA